MVDFDTGLERCPANHQPLTPLLFLERAGAVFPGHTAVVHGSLRRTYRELRDRCRRLASALARRGIGRGDVVAALLPNIPEMVEAHYGVPMAGAVLNTINTRLDANTVAYILGHGEAVGEHVGRALHEEQRRQRLVVGRAALQAGVEVHGHKPQRCRQAGSRLPMKAPMPSVASSASRFSTMTALAAS